MRYRIFKDKIEVEETPDFNIEDTLECGQVFRYKVADNGYEVYALNHKAKICCQKGGATIFCDDPKFFEKYFDFDTNYGTIKTELKGEDLLDRAIAAGSGIRILRQDPVETIISFIISANNNIPRIKKILERICEGYGSKMDGYYAFPTIEQLSTIPQELFSEIGCGYRAPYLFKTIKMLSEGFPLEEIGNMPIVEARKKLTTLYGVGGKVADCILLYGYHRTDVFPCDTWIKKVYVQCYNGNEKLSAEKISEYFVSLYGNNAGFAQQYLYYYKRLKEK